MVTPIDIKGKTLGFIDSRIGGRKENQDSAGIKDTPLGYLVVVCDGMGGMQGGSTASQLAVKTILETVASEDGVLKEQSGWTDIFIYPPYEFQCIDGLITNFHLPESTLIMLVSAFAGYEHTMHAYQTAVQQQYRFFSFGDSMLIL